MGRIIWLIPNVSYDNMKIFLDKTPEISSENHHRKNVKIHSETLQNILNLTPKISNFLLNSGKSYGIGKMNFLRNIESSNED